MFRLPLIVSTLFVFLAACTTPDAALEVEEPAPSTESEGDQSAVEITPALVYATESDVQTRTLLLDVYVQPGGAARPVIVLLHGGSGSKDHQMMVEMSEHLADEGLVVFNVTYLSLPASPETLLADNGRGLRAGQEAVACAVDFARQNAATYGGDPDNMMLMGQSAGGFFGLIHALSGGMGDRWADFATPAGPEPQIACTAAAGDGLVDGFVGFNGSYFIFDAAPLENDPELKALTDPKAVVDGNPALKVRFILGEQDPTQPDWHLEKVAAFADELAAAGHDAAVVRIDAGHPFSFEEPALSETLGAVGVIAGR